MAKRKNNKKKTRSKKQKEEEYDDERPSMSPETKQRIAVIVLLVIGILSLLSLVGLAGPLGNMLSVALTYLFGWGDFLAPVIFIIWSYRLMRTPATDQSARHFWGGFLVVLGVYGILHWTQGLEFLIPAVKTGHGGGLIGLLFSWPLMKVLGTFGSLIVLLASVIIGSLLAFDTLIERLFGEYGFFRRIFLKARYRSSVEEEEYEEDEEYGDTEERVFDDTGEDEEEEYEEDDNNEGEQVESESEARQRKEKSESPDVDGVTTRKIRRRMPKIDIPIELLSAKSSRPNSGDILVNQQTIQRTLANFGIEVEMGEVSVGPTVTQYTLRPAEGIKLTQITTLQNDIALALAAHPIRIEAPIPGKSLVGIEVPNHAVAIVTLRELLVSKEFRRNRPSHLTLPLGKDVAGKTYLADLNTMPHLLIAGATGSGKSIAINALLNSLMFQNQPSDLKFILVDPKRVELSVYAHIPYLLTPVITEVKQTVSALRWAVAEMDRRYECLSRAGRRKIESYNQTVDPTERLPYIIIVIDELADLMSLAAADVESAIVRLAQMARAVGIHLIVATQRPSVDVITGLIKANITSRIAFSVASLTDSRTILDTSGAEKLLGRGDMLFISADLSKPRRLQGAYLTDTEIDAVTRYLREKAKPDYIEEVTSAQVNISGNGMGGDGHPGHDELLNEAKESILGAGKASASFLQRRLRIGYARAARILDILEDEGVIGPADGAKPREILITKEEVIEEYEEEYDEDGGQNKEVVYEEGDDEEEGDELEDEESYEEETDGQQQEEDDEEETEYENDEETTNDYNEEEESEQIFEDEEEWEDEEDEKERK